MLTGNRKILTPIFIIAFIIMIVSGIIFLIYPDNELSYRLFNLLIAAGQFIGLGVLLLNTKFKIVFKRVLIKVGIGLFILSIVWKLMHLPLNDLGIILSVLILIVDNIIFYYRKEGKVLLDYVLSIWFPVFFTAVVFNFNHYPGGDLLSFISSCILWIAIIGYFFTIEKKITGANKPS